MKGTVGFKPKCRVVEINGFRLNNKCPITNSCNSSLACEPLMAMNGDYFYDLSGSVFCSAWHRGYSNKCWMKESFTEYILFPNDRIYSENIKDRIKHRRRYLQGHSISYPSTPPLLPTAQQSSLKVNFVGGAILHHPRNWNDYFHFSCYKLGIFLICIKKWNPETIIPSQLIW